MPDENILDNEQQEEVVEVNEEGVIDKIWIDSEHKHPLGGLAENILLEEGNPINIKDVLLTKSEKEYYNDNYIYINGGEGNETRHNESAVIGTNLRTWNDNQIVIGQRDTYNEKASETEEELAGYNFIVCNSNATWSPASTKYQTEAAFAVGGEKAKFQVPVIIQNGGLEINGSYASQLTKSFKVADNKVTTDMTLEVSNIKSSNQNNTLTFDSSTKIISEGILSTNNLYNKHDNYMERYTVGNMCFNNEVANIRFSTQPQVDANVTFYHWRSQLGEHMLVLQFDFEVGGTSSSVTGSSWNGYFLYNDTPLEAQLKDLLQNYLIGPHLFGTYTSWASSMNGLQIHINDSDNKINFKYYTSDNRITDNATPQFWIPLYLKRTIK